jgi:REP-associated tyrosine transposase
MPIPEIYLARFEPGEFYHIYNRCHSGRLLFKQPDDYTFFFDSMKKHLYNWMDFYSYCLIPNHFHLLVKISELVQLKGKQVIPTHQEISNQFRRMFISYTNRQKSIEDFHGGLFDTPFRRIKISTDDYFTNVLYYINHNAVHHKICKKIIEYPYSSYDSLISKKPTILKRDEVLHWFGGREKFIAYHDSDIEDYIGKPYYYEEVG